EFARVDDNADPAMVDVQAQVENRQAGLRGDRQPHLGCQLQAVSAVHFFFGEEKNDELFQPGRILLRQSSKERQLGCDLCPQGLIKTGAFQRPPAAPFATETHRQRREVSTTPPSTRAKPARW